MGSVEDCSHKQSSRAQNSNKWRLKVCTLCDKYRHWKRRIRGKCAMGSRIDLMDPIHMHTSGKGSDERCPELNKKESRRSNDRRPCNRYRRESDCIWTGVNGTGKKSELRAMFNWKENAGMNKKWEGNGRETRKASGLTLSPQGFARFQLDGGGGVLPLPFCCCCIRVAIGRSGASGPVFTLGRGC